MIARVVRPKKHRPFLYPGEEVKPSREPKLRLHGATKHAIETGRMRLIVAAGLMSVAFVTIAVRLVGLMVLHDTPQSVAHSTEPATAPMTRADILDRNGVIIATDLPTSNLIADSQQIPDIKEAVDKLTATLPDLRYDDVMKRLSSGQRFIYLRRGLTPDEKKAVNDLGIPGISFEESETRAYLQGSLFAHIVGAIDTDNHGVAGIEKTFDDRLAHQREPLMLSLDVRVQQAVHESLSAAVNIFHAIGGAAVVMDVSNGEIVGMVSLPDYDPKAIGDASVEARFNRATKGTYEMGSAFKLFTAAMTLDAGTSTLTSIYDAAQPITIGRFTIKDYHGLNRPESVPEILIHSSNLGAARMAMEAGTDVQKEYFRRFGLLSPLRLELPEVGAPQYPSTWREINTITMAYGHGISVTPVHMATAVSALVNGGILYPPTVLRRDPGTALSGRRVISQKTSDDMRALMRMIVATSDGTGRQAEGVVRVNFGQAPGYLIGGKTGSADKVSPHGGYLKNSNLTVFASAFPIDAPRYTVFVMLDEPKGIKETYNFATAGWNAVPTVGSIIAKIGPMLGVFPMGHEDDFQPLVALMKTYTNSGHDDYGTQQPVVVKAVAKAAAPIVEAPGADPFAETNDPTTNENAAADHDAIGSLISEQPVVTAEHHGGPGAAR